MYRPSLCLASLLLAAVALLFGVSCSVPEARAMTRSPSEMRGRPPQSAAPATAGVPCEYAVLSGESAEYAARGFSYLYPQARLGTMGDREAQSLMQDFPAMLDAHLASHGDTESGEMAQIFRDGGYVVQIVPFTSSGGRLVHLHLLGKSSLFTHWRQSYVFMNDGGTGNCFVTVHSEARKILDAFCSGNG